MVGDVTGRNGRFSAGYTGHPQVSPDSLWGGLRNSVCRPISLFRGWRSSLRRKWNRSTARKTAQEICRIPARILAVHRNKNLALGIPLPEGPLDHGLGHSDWSYTFQRDCSSCIERLQAENAWAGDLDLEMAARSFQRGAAWGLRNSGNEKHSVDS